MISRAIAEALQRRWTEPVFGVVRRRGPATDLTGADLSARAGALAAHWRAVLGPGRHVVVLVLPAGEAFLVALLAGLLDGALAVTAAAQPRRGSRTQGLGHIVADSGASAVICEAAARERIIDTLKAADGGAGVPVLAVDDAEERPVAAPRRGWHGDAEMPAIIQYTSGSTRLPKGVCLTGANILANCAEVQRGWGLGADARVVNWLPHYHDMGLLGGILYPLLSGVWSAQMSPFDVVRDPAFWLRTISTHRGTFSGGPAFAFADCLKRVRDDDLEGVDLASWERAYCGAEPVPAGLPDAFQARFARYGLRSGAVFACYGLAETTLFAAGAPEAPAPPPATTAGRTYPCAVPPVLAGGIRIVDPETATPLPEGAVGEIWLSGLSVAQGYLGRETETQATFVDADLGGGPARWLRTGDLGVLGAGWLSVTGRLKDVLVVNGRKIAAAEVEWLAAGQHSSLDPHGAAAFQPAGGDPGTAVLLIERKDGSAVADAGTLADIRLRIVRAVLGEWGLHLADVRILPRGALERTTSGKIRRQAIAAAYVPLSPEQGV